MDAVIADVAGATVAAAAVVVVVVAALAAVVVNLSVTSSSIFSRIL